MEVVTVKNPAAWELPFVKRALSSIPGTPEEIDFSAVLEAYEILLVFNEGEPQTLAVLSFHNGPLRDMPAVVLFYSEGDAEARNALISTIIARIKEEGYQRFMTGNWSGGSDRAWQRLFKQDGVTFTPVGTTFMVEVLDG